MVHGAITHVALEANAESDGEAFSYLDFLMLQQARVVAGSESGFNAMAAVTGQHRRRLFLPDCVLRFADQTRPLASSHNYVQL
jgi:hypothetical protein